MSIEIRGGGTRWPLFCRWGTDGVPLRPKALQRLAPSFLISNSIPNLSGHSVYDMILYISISIIDSDKKHHRYRSNHHFHFFAISFVFCHSSSLKTEINVVSVSMYIYVSNVCLSCVTAPRGWVSLCRRKSHCCYVQVWHVVRSTSWVRVLHCWTRQRCRPWALQISLTAPTSSVVLSTSPLSSGKRSLKSRKQYVHWLVIIMLRVAWNPLLLLFLMSDRGPG